MKLSRDELAGLLNWAFKKGQLMEAKSQAQALAYSELLSEYCRYRVAHGDEELKL